MPARKDQSFEDPEFYQAKQETKKRFSKILTDLQKTVERNGYAVQTVQRFKGCLENPHNNDITRLPFYSNSAFSKKRNRINCVLSTVSYTTQLYWRFCTLKEQKTKELADNYLTDLEHVIKKGLSCFKVAQTKGFSGFYLEEIK